MQSKAQTVKEYLKSLPEDKRIVIEKVRNTILKSLPKGYEECMQYGMIGYVVPLKLYPNGYLNKKDTPLPFASLASQKNHCAVYLMGVYGDKELAIEFKKDYESTGQKLDMGKSCVKFKNLEDVNLEALGKIISKVSVKRFIQMYEKSRNKK
jgi:hypothetical protein